MRPTLLTPGEVAEIFRVDPKTVSRWALKGKLPFIRTLGGHRRFDAATIYAMMAESEEGGDLYER